MCVKNVVKSRAIVDSSTNIRKGKGREGEKGKGRREGRGGKGSIQGRQQKNFSYLAQIMVAT